MYHMDFERVKVSVDKDILKLLEKVDKTREPIIIECVDGPTVVVLNLEEFESISATLEVEEDPGMKDALRESIGEAKEGKYFTHKEVFGHSIEQAPIDE